MHWWVLDDDHRGRRREATLWTSTGHAAAVYGDELYDVLPQTRGGYGRLQDFGIRFGYERVVLHLEPQVQVGRLESNTARTLLLLDHEPLPWSRWGEESTAAMPEEIPPTPRTHGQHRRNPPPRSDPQPRSVNPAALPPQSLPTDTASRRVTQTSCDRHACGIAGRQTRDRNSGPAPTAGARHGEHAGER